VSLCSSIAQGSDLNHLLYRAR